MSFWDFLWLLLIWTPLAVLWGVALADIFRRDDISGGPKVLWTILVLLLPLLGTLIYLMTRSAGSAEEARAATDRARVEPAPPTSAQQLTMLADLRDRGVLTPEEFAAEKSQLLGPRAAPGDDRAAARVPEDSAARPAAPAA
ncbi:SHOCT domain-containing protein [Kocuria turfanensis]|uniref:Membrane protein n=1 Tax=Kocuria turfanensis TaxID=388357 RepID=A0A512IG15_9MICC|nr:SHOCT domain-containing protein [Kocuria turfanensis]GEO96646.1 membrane protein [Kocuria turfanensis]